MIRSDAVAEERDREQLTLAADVLPGRILPAPESTRPARAVWPPLAAEGEFAALLTVDLTRSDGWLFSPAVRQLRLRTAAAAITAASASASPARSVAPVRMCSPNRNTPSRLADSGSRMVNPGWEAASGPAARACEASSMVAACRAARPAGGPAGFRVDVSSYRLLLEARNLRKHPPIGCFHDHGQKWPNRDQNYP